MKELAVKTFFHIKYGNLKEESFVTADNIDRLIQTAIEQKHYEIQILLMDYKAKHISAQTTAEIIRNKFYL